MKFVDEYHDVELGRGLAERICQKSTRQTRIMEFCGSHTGAIMRYGIRQLLPATIEMVSGPGCPVCVSANADLDKAIALSREPSVIITTFGDMMRVPGSHSSLKQERAEGADIRMVYSTLDALQIARDNPQKSVVFLGIGFETTAPTVAASILTAEREGIENYFVLSLHKLTPPVMKELLDSDEVKLNAILCPGHVSTVIGSRPYEFIAREYGTACVVSGFEPLDILLAIKMLVGQIEAGEPKVEIAYQRAVRPEGNQQAFSLMRRVFEVCPAKWRGIGVVPSSGLRLKKEYEHFDAERAFAINPGKPSEPKGCICGDILRGLKTPPECKLFGKLCTPERAVGPCMVSSEGTCAAYYQYGRIDYG